MLGKPSFRFISFPILLLLQLVSACSPSAQNLQGERWVIFPAEQAKDQRIGDWFAKNGQTEYWTPSDKDILALEKGLRAYLQNNPDRFYEEIPVWERLDEYDRQYIGIVLDGKRIIYANYFCDHAEMDWRKDFVFVMDGGDCFFQFKYDVDSAEFFDLQVNGVA
jgi:hypothetical protein